MIDIAVTGIGCRFPGGIHDAESYWQFLLDKGNGIIEVPSDRWSLDKYYDPDPEAPGRMYTRSGGFLQQSLWDFDPDFFGISQREASIMDPQQRLLLEVTWEALDDAGMAGRVSGAPIGVFVGAFIFDNAIGRMGPLVRSSINNHTSTSSTQTLLSNRLSYLLDLRGPSMSVDTACSSSLVATHLAVQAISNGECEAAIVGGANVLLQPETFISMCKGGFLSVDGRCKSFDAAADGYGRAEGAGAVLLKPLSAAIADQDRIYAVIKGSGVNQDGRTIALPVPNRDAQESLARRVCRVANIDPHRVDFIEAHGTGTAVGDPIEMAALGTVFGAVDGRQAPLPVGSVKNNIGHTEAAAGVASLIKGALTLHHNTIAPQSSLDNPNPEIPFEDLRLRIPMEAEPLTQGRETATVAVNGFGYGGTNAHVVMQSAPIPSADVHAGSGRPVVQVLPISARNESATRALARSVRGAIGSGHVDFVTRAMWTRRAHHPTRVAFAYTDSDDLQSQLTAYADGGSTQPQRAVTDGKSEPVFVFSGMGPQWWAMGRGLLESNPVYAATAKEIDEVFTEISGWSIIEEMTRGESDSRIALTDVAQPANFLLQVALTAALGDIGVRPGAIVGHSVGEVASAYVSGALSLRDALQVSYHRARLQATTAGTGGMLAVGLSEQEARELTSHTPTISIAAINSDTSVTLSGNRDDLEAIRESLDGAGSFAKFLRVTVPYHSALMDPIIAELDEALSHIESSDGSIDSYSTVTGKRALGIRWDGAYWCRNVREPVLLADAINGLLDAEHRVFLEIGAHPVLGGNIRETLVRRNIPGAAIGTLSRDRSDQASLLHVVSDLYMAGAFRYADPNVGAISPHVDLPAYPWQRQRVWHEEPSTLLDKFGVDNDFAMLGDPLAGPVPGWQVELAIARLPWLFDHVVDDVVILPAAAYLDAALSAAVTRTGSTSLGLESVEFVAPLVVDPHDVPVMRLTVEDSTHRFAIHSRSATETTWTLNASGRLVEADFDPVRVDLPDLSDTVTITGSQLYDGLAELGLRYGKAFRHVDEIAIGKGRVVGKLAARDNRNLDASSSRHLVSPTVVDSALQCVAALGWADGTGASSGGAVPYSIRYLRWLGPLPDDAYVSVEQTCKRPLRADISIASRDGDVALDMRGVEFRQIFRSSHEPDALARLFYEPVWEPLEIESADPGGRPRTGESVIVVSLGESAGNRADILTATLGDSVQHTPVTAVPDQRLEERMIDALSSALEQSGDAQVRVIVVVGDESDGPENVFCLAQIARAVEHFLSQETDTYRHTRAFRIVVVTDGAICLPQDGDVNIAHAPLMGARRSLLNEQPEARWTLVDIRQGDWSDIDIVAKAIFDASPQRDPADEVAWRQGTPWVARLSNSVLPHRERADAARVSDDPNASFEVECPESHLLSDLTLREIKRVAPGPGEIEVRMQAVGLNYKDAMKVVGVLNEREMVGTYFGTSVGMEGAGVVERIGPDVTDVVPGDSIFVFTRGMMRKFLTIPLDSGATLATKTWDAHDPDPLECGSALPFFTAEHGLNTVARLQPGETVLVHGAAGGMGMAAVQVARNMGARVIATASTPERRATVMAGGVVDVLNSRSLNFVEDVMRLTDNRGVDVIFNSAPGEVLLQNLNIAAEFGRVIEIGKTDIFKRGVMSLVPFERNLGFFSVDMDRAMAKDPEIVRRPLRITQNALRQGTYSALPYTAYPLTEMASAFESVARSTHAGRVVLDFRGDLPPVRPKSSSVKIDAHASYLVTGGFGAFGLATARWLVRNGARHLVLIGRSGAATEAARNQVAQFEAAGVDVQTERCDISDYDAVRGIVQRTQESGAPLRGVFHAAGVVNNFPIAQLTLESLTQLFVPKVDGALNLDRATDNLGVDLDYFVLYSSISALIGVSPQVGYAAANSVLDALACRRKSRGKPALSVNWGFLSGGGMADSSEVVSTFIGLFGFVPVDMDTAAQFLSECLTYDAPEVAIADVDWAKWAARAEGSADKFRFRTVLADAKSRCVVGSATKSAIMGVPAGERAEAMATHLASELAQVLRTSPESLDLDMNILELGLDSLMAMEFSARTEKELGVRLSVFEFSRGLTLRGVATKLLDQLVSSDD